MSQSSIPDQRGFLRKIGSMGRLIYFDPRGMGLSDTIGSWQMPTLESQMGDILSVMDAVAARRAGRAPRPILRQGLFP